LDGCCYIYLFIYKQNEFSIVLQKPNLILNVDGAIGVIFVDIMRESGSFTKYVVSLFLSFLLYIIYNNNLNREEASEIIESGALNGLFVLGRSIGFIGHYLDQKRLKQDLYRHPWDDITYMMPEMQNGDAV
jgi:ATP citrate (pro-S)-lyase